MLAGCPVRYRRALSACCPVCGLLPVSKYKGTYKYPGRQVSCVGYLASSSGTSIQTPGQVGRWAGGLWTLNPGIRLREQIRLEAQREDPYSKKGLVESTRFNVERRSLLDGVVVVEPVVLIDHRHVAMCSANEKRASCSAVGSRMETARAAADQGCLQVILTYEVVRDTMEVKVYVLAECQSHRIYHRNRSCVGGS